MRIQIIARRFDSKDCEWINWQTERVADHDEAKQRVDYIRFVEPTLCACAYIVIPGAGIA